MTSGASDAWLTAYATHLQTRSAHTRHAYWRDIEVLKELAGDLALAEVSAAQLRRFLAILHGRGLSGRSLARVLSGWRAFYRFVTERDPSFKDNPCMGLRAPKTPKKLPAALSPDEAVQLVTIDGDEALSVRDRALFELEETRFIGGARQSPRAILAIRRSSQSHWSEDTFSALPS